MNAAPNASALQAAPSNVSRFSGRVVATRANGLPVWATPSAPQSSDAVEQPASRSPSPEITPGVEAAGGEGEMA